MADSKPRRGRPRPPESIERDETIHRLLSDTGPLTRNQIAEQTGFTHSLVYLALSRLRQAGRVKRCLDNGQTVWSMETGQPCP
jgi:predicted transcriptional regulator